MARRRPLVLLLAVGLTVLGCELVARVGLGLVTGSWRPLAETSRARSEIVGQPLDGATDEDDPAPVQFFLGHEALHPYLGFVQNRDVTEIVTPKGRTVPRRLDPLGFVAPPGTDAEAADDATLEVAVVGGSMALMVAQHGVEALKSTLAEALTLGTDEVSVRNWAMGGYKQPQQLMTVALRTSLGERPDVVVNLDGYNEVVLGWTQGIDDGTTAYFPRAWRWRLGRLAGDDAGTAAELARLGGRRREMAARFEHPLLRHSAIANVGWMLIDRGLAGQAARAREQGADSGGGFPVTGPSPEVASTDQYLDEVRDRWVASSEALGALCEGLGIAYIHALQPNQYLPGSKPISELEREIAYDDTSIEAQLVRDGYPRLRAAAVDLDQAGVTFLDLTQIFAERSDDLYIDPCCHVGAEGNRRIAEALARAIAKRLVPVPVDPLSSTR